MEEFIISDRYSALGLPLPNPETMCKGPCEGIGSYPQRGDDPSMTTEERKRWDIMEAKEPTDDMYHFITCPECEGTGKGV